MLQDLLKEKEVLKKELVDKANSFVSEYTDEVEEVEHIMDMDINFDQWIEIEDKIEEYNDICNDIENNEEPETENTCSFCGEQCEDYFCNDECKKAELND